MAAKAKTRRSPAKPVSNKPSAKSPSAMAATVTSSSPSSRKVEGIAAALSACLFAALVIYLGVLGFSSGSDFADLEVKHSRPYDRGGAVLVDVAVRNSGSKSAADVLVIARINGEQVSEIVFDYVPSGSTRQGTIRLAGDVAPARLDIAVAAYRDP